MKNRPNGNYIVDSPARGAGDGIKPGALAPGSRSQKGSSPQSGATAFNGTIRMFNFVMSKINHFAKNANHELCRPLRGLGNPGALDPGAYAPGFMLSHASRALL